MRCLPIPFKPEMVRAVLSGAKTQTRRIASTRQCVLGEEFPGPRGSDGFSRAYLMHRESDRAAMLALCPYGQPGDRLWVREAFRFPASLDRRSPKVVGDMALDAGYSTPWAPTQYDADGARRGEWRGFETPPTESVPGKYRPPMFMPRWASRITLEVTGVRVERLQDISEADAVAEGCEARPFPGPWWQGYKRDDEGELHHQQVVGNEPPDWMVEPHKMKPLDHLNVSAKAEYQLLWNSINGPDSWATNPWVWVVEFRRLP